MRSDSRCAHEPSLANRGGGGGGINMSSSVHAIISISRADRLTSPPNFPQRVAQHPAAGKHARDTPPRSPPMSPALCLRIRTRSRMAGGAFLVACSSHHHRENNARHKPCANGDLKGMPELSARHASSPNGSGARYSGLSSTCAGDSPMLLAGIGGK
jgi:hypothetical protein